MILVTGASGFIGGHVARLLVDRGHQIRVLVRPTSILSGIADLPLERAVGDLREIDSLRKAIRGCRQLYHVAADYRLWAQNPDEIYRSNVEGTRNILQVAGESDAEKVVYTSTVGTIGIPGDGTLGTEDSPASQVDLAGDYKKSKLEAERLALKFATQGLPVVIVNPTAPVGEGDLKPTPTGKIIVDFLRGAMPAYVDTGLNLVDVRDVARGHLLAAEKGSVGERYILGARNMTLREILEALSTISGRPAPRFRLPYWAALGFSVAEAVTTRFSGREPRAPREAVRMARKKMFVSTNKAQRDLGFNPGPVENALQRAVEWFQEHGYC